MPQRFRDFLFLGIAILVATDFQESKVVMVSKHRYCLNLCQIFELHVHGVVMRWCSLN